MTMDSLKSVRAAGGSKRRALLLVLLASAPLMAPPAHAQLPSYERIRVLESARQIDDARLTDRRDADFSSVTFGIASRSFCSASRTARTCARSQWSGYASCTTLVPRDANVAYVMISVDGERDTPAAMKAFLAKYSSEFIGLTADPDGVSPSRSSSRHRFSKAAATGTTAATTLRTRRRSSCSTQPDAFAQKCTAHRSTRWPAWRVRLWERRNGEPAADKALELSAGTTVMARSPSKTLQRSSRR